MRILSGRIQKIRCLFSSAETRNPRFPDYREFSMPVAENGPDLDSAGQETPE